MNQTINIENNNLEFLKALGKINLQSNPHITETIILVSMETYDKIIAKWGEVPTQKASE